MSCLIKKSVKLILILINLLFAYTHSIDSLFCYFLLTVNSSICSLQSVLIFFPLILLFCLFRFFLLLFTLLFFILILNNCSLHFCTFIIFIVSQIAFVGRILFYLSVFRIIIRILLMLIIIL